MKSASASSRKGRHLARLRLPGFRLVEPGGPPLRGEFFRTATAESLLDLMVPRRGVTAFQKTRLPLHTVYEGRLNVVLSSKRRSELSSVAAKSKVAQAFKRSGATNSD